ncbi:MAG: Rid family detoxifying hydrolase [Saprospiraceae bacterium]
MKKIINTPNAPAPVGPYNQAIIHGDTLYASGQIAINPATGELVTETIEAETHQVMQNIKAILEEAGLGFEDVIKCSVFVSDMNQYSRINVVYATYFNEATAPARELVEVANLPKFVNVEISVIAGFGLND